MVENCKFGKGSAAFFTTAAIAIVDNASGGVIRNNIIAGGAIGISLAGTCVDISVLDNSIQCYSEAEGAGITIGVGSGNSCWIDGNRAGSGRDSSANNPFLDSHGDDSNDWGVNWNQEDPTLPA